MRGHWIFFEVLSGSHLHNMQSFSQALQETLLLSVAQLRSGQLNFCGDKYFRNLLTSIDIASASRFDFFHHHSYEGTLGISRFQAPAINQNVCKKKAWISLLFSYHRNAINNFLSIYFNVFSRNHGAWKIPPYGLLPTFCVESIQSTKKYWESRYHIFPSLSFEVSQITIKAQTGLLTSQLVLLSSSSQGMSSSSWGMSWFQAVSDCSVGGDFTKWKIIRFRFGDQLSMT